MRASTSISDRLGGPVARRDGLQLERGLALVELGHLHHVAGQTLEQSDLGFDVGQMAAVEQVAGLLGRRIRQDKQAVHRRAQLVRRVRHQAAPAQFAFLQAQRHVVERQGQFGQLALLGGIEGGAQATVGQPGGEIAHAVEFRLHAAREGQDHQRRQDGEAGQHQEDVGMQREPGPAGPAHYQFAAGDRRGGDQRAEARSLHRRAALGLAIRQNAALGVAHQQADRIMARAPIVDHVAGFGVLGPQGRDPVGLLLHVVLPGLVEQAVMDVIGKGEGDDQTAQGQGGGAPIEEVEKAGASHIPSQASGDAGCNSLWPVGWAGIKWLRGHPRPAARWATHPADRRSRHRSAAGRPCWPRTAPRNPRSRSRSIGSCRSGIRSAARA